MKNSTFQRKIGSLLSYAQMGLNIIINLLFTPVMLRLLGQSEYGLYSTVSSTIAMLSILSLGFNSGYIRYYAKYKKDNDRDSIEKLNGLFLIIFTVIGLVCLVCGAFLTINIRIVFDRGLTSGEYEIAKVLMLILTINLAISFPMSVFQHIISAHEKFIYLKSLGVIKTVLSPLVTLPLLLAGYRSIAMVAVTVIISLIVDISYYIYVKRVLNEKFVFHSFEKGLLISLFTYTGFIAINMIVDQVNNNIDKILLGRYQGTIEVAVYSVGYTLYHMYSLLSTSISGVFTPKIHAIANRSNSVEAMNSDFTNLFVKVGRIQYLILSLVASGLVFFGRDFIRFWAGNGYEDAYYVALLLVIPATITLTQTLGIEIQRAENKHQFRSIAYGIMAICNFVLTIYLCQAYGSIGAAIGTAIAFVVANGIIMNIFYSKKCGIAISKYWSNIGRISIGLIAPCVFGFAIKKILPIDSVFKLVFEIITYSVVYFVSMWLVGMNSYEKNLFTEPIRKIFCSESK